MREKFDENKVDLKDKKYEKEYSEAGLWEKIGKVAKKAGLKTIYYALLLFYALQSEKVSIADKALIIGALGYFILPIDFIPDFMIPVGYLDDGTVMWGLIKRLDCIDEDVKAQAQEKLKDWFGNYDKSKLK